MTEKKIPSLKRFEGFDITFPPECCAPRDFTEAKIIIQWASEASELHM